MTVNDLAAHPAPVSPIFSQQPGVQFSLPD